MSAPAISALVRGGGDLVPVVREALVDLRPAAPAVCVVPEIPGPGPLAELTDAGLAEVGDALDAVLAEVQQVLGTAERLVFVLPHAPLMGLPEGVASSAVTNGVLSLARTLAIELARDSVTVNVLATDAGVPALRAQLAALLGGGGGAITGQEIYLTGSTGGSVLGRLRP